MLAGGDCRQRFVAADNARESMLRIDFALRPISLRAPAEYSDSGVPADISFIDVIDRGCGRNTGNSLLVASDPDPRMASSPVSESSPLLAALRHVSVRSDI